MPEVPENPRVEEVDKSLSAWRQGDCVLGEQVFVHRFDPDLPLADPELAGAEPGVQNAEMPVKGLVVLTQTCDIVRSCANRPYLEVCPLVQVDGAKLHDIERGRYPGYAFLPGLASKGLVADLDRVMTIEKPIAASWSRTPGCSTDQQGREFAGCLARKRARFAFPDDFTNLAKKLVSHLKSKHGKGSPEGRALQVLREIRVRAAPDWDADPVTITFWFVRLDEAHDFEGSPWEGFLEKWLKLVPAGGRFKNIEGVVVQLEDLTAADYVESDPLDLDHLSTGTD